MFSKREKLQPSWHRFIAIYLFFIYIILLVIPTGATGQDAINNSCLDCHKKLSPFSDEQSRLTEIVTNHTGSNISCSLECHEDIIRKKAVDNYQQWSDSAHSEYYVTCDACHGGNPAANNETSAHTGVKAPDDPNSSVNFKNIPDTCGKCHTEELDHFKNTMHYQRLRAESRAPSCITCHQPHTFKVLKAAELPNVCSVCHNQKDNIANPTVPDDAKQALEKQNALQEEIINAKNIVAQAKAKGMDVSTAQMDLDAAVAVMNNAPSLWHGFNLKDFDTQIQSGIDHAKKAEYIASDTEPVVPSTPSVGIALVLGVFALLYMMKKR